ncbi:hypothetical protein [Streptomyces sp. NPDC020489]|uniref:hypothetical protein n=1 Tax=Streptomyces sp. NPDC020489 TaxID=3365077 RepID=UPI0037B903E4
MDQVTQATTTTASTDARQLAGPRAAYKRAEAVAQRIVDRLTSVMPNAVELCRDRDTYGIRVHFGLGLAAGRGVLELAALAGAEVTRDAIVSEAWLECRTLVEGVPLVARALLKGDEADRLLLSTEPAPPAPEQEAAGPVETAVVHPVPLGASVIAVAPVVAPAAGGEQ